jgi:hypothetical protein
MPDEVENHIVKKLSFPPYKNSTTANHEMKKNQKHQKKKKKIIINPNHN